MQGQKAHKDWVNGSFEVTPLHSGRGGHARWWRNDKFAPNSQFATSTEGKSDVELMIPKIENHYWLFTIVGINQAVHYTLIGPGRLAVVAKLQVSHHRAWPPLQPSPRAVRGACPCSNFPSVHPSILRASLLMLKCSSCAADRRPTDMAYTHHMPSPIKIRDKHDCMFPGPRCVRALLGFGTEVASI